MDQARLKAARANQTHYQGQECKHGHGSTRYTASGACIECAKGRSKQTWKKIHATLKAVRGI